MTQAEQGQACAQLFRQSGSQEGERVEAVVKKSEGMEVACPRAKSQRQRRAEAFHRQQ